MLATQLLVVIATAFITLTRGDDGTVMIDDGPGVGRMFDGIGGLSGGGATSKLLVNYPQKQRDEILDYLFKPKFGASLQIIKVEIGGDAQSTDGTEASHMHYEWEEPNYYRGYEWWLIQEAKKRNKNIKLYALPWGFPGWVGQGHKNSPYTNLTKTADYVTRWVEGAKSVYGLDTDYVGIWNERGWNADYVRTLRATLDARGFANTKLVVADGDWGPGEYITTTDATFRDTMYAIGAHYPGTYSNPGAQQAGPQLWSSEDFSSYNDETGGGCWARILNQNYVNGYMSSTISWNLIASYYNHLPFYRDGLMTAVEPWSGNYTVETPIWISAHTTQFTEVGWYYLTHGNGVGHLPKGGSIVTLMGPDMGPFNGQPFSIIIETMTHDHSGCIRPGLPAYTVEPQTITLQLQGSFLYSKMGHSLHVRYSKLGFNGQPDVMFEKKDDIKISADGKMTLTLGLDEVWTLSTYDDSQKGNYPNVPQSQPFPLPYSDNFEAYDQYAEPNVLAQQMGSWEVLGENLAGSSKGGFNNKFIRQMMVDQTVAWCGADTGNQTLSIVGDYWKEVFVQTSVRLPLVNASSGIYIAALVPNGGCSANKQNGIYLTVTPTQYMVTSDITATKVVKSGSVNLKPGQWHNVSLLVEDNAGSKVATAAFDGQSLFSKLPVPGVPAAGFAAIGTASYGLADFDNFKLDKSSNGQKIMEKYLTKKHPKSLLFVPEHQLT